MTNITETTVRMAEGANQCEVKFICNDGNRVSVLLDNVPDDSYEAIIQRAKSLLAASSRPELADHSVTSGVAELTQEDTQIDILRPEGPQTPLNPLLEGHEPDGKIIRVEGEGIIEPQA